MKRQKCLSVLETGHWAILAIIFRSMSRRTKRNALEQSSYMRQTHKPLTCTKKTQ